MQLQAENGPPQAKNLRIYVFGSNLEHISCIQIIASSLVRTFINVKNTVQELPPQAKNVRIYVFGSNFKYLLFLLSFLDAGRP